MLLNRAVFAFLLLFLSTILNSAYSDVVLFEEDFDDMKLGPTINEEVPADDVWTDEPPDGWSIEDDLAAEGMPEWNGWAFADAVWWTQTAGDQDRSLFTVNGKAFQTIAIADPDEWDDLGDPDSQGDFNSWLSTPVIKVSGVVANSTILTFDSSWRPEDTQNAEVTVSFDGGDAIVIIRMDSSGTDTIYKEPQNNVEMTLPDGEQVNETIEIDVPNPDGANTAVLTWAMLDATNDWWWAIDNIVLKTTADVTAVAPSGKLSTVWGDIKAN
jgi:hypothetical protein